MNEVKKNDKTCVTKLIKQAIKVPVLLISDYLYCGNFSSAVKCLYTAITEINTHPAAMDTRPCKSSHTDDIKPKSENVNILLLLFGFIFITVENNIYSPARINTQRVTGRTANSTPKAVAIHFPPRILSKGAIACPKTGAVITSENSKLSEPKTLYAMYTGK